VIALFGGTFNPVHNGHISLARQVAQAFDLDTVQLLPSYLPVHRDEPQIDAGLRLAMLELAIQPYAELSVNDIEIRREGYSYSIDTLKALHEQYPDQSLCWLMGVDAFNGFGRWKDPQGILQLANLIVCARPEVSLMPSGFDSHVLADGESLARYQAGKIALFAMHPNSCSSTQVRLQLQSGQSATACLSEPVLEFIQHNRLYEN
jgi:nicotinate-nucleotide adenylyltransferase